MRRVRIGIGAALCALTAVAVACTVPPEIDVPPTTSTSTSTTSTSTTSSSTSTTSTTSSTTSTTTTTAPETPTEIAVVSDYGYDHPYIETLGHMVRTWDPDYVITTGDNVQTPLAVAGTDKYDLVVGKHFCPFLANAAPGPKCPSGGTSATNRFFPAPGNHDHSDAGIENYKAYFALPGAGTTSTNTSGSELYYDVVLGPVHVFVVDSDTMWWERNLPAHERVNTNVQRAWLQQAMASSTARWQVVALHHPAYGSSADYGSQTFAQLPYAEWGADLVLNGHAAVYERVHRNGIPFVTNGLGGGHPTTFGVPTAGSMFRYNEDVATSVKLTATNTSLDLALITVEGDTIDTHSLG